MNKVALLIPAHCVPEVLKLTMGTYLETYDGSYELSFCVCMHSNYPHYSERIDEITSMPNVNFVFVDEIDWHLHDVFRYSAMHAKSLVTLLEWASKSDCTHVAVLDHDLIFKGDFVTWALSKNNKADWICGLFEDVEEPREAAMRVEEGNQEVKLLFAPKPTVWHMLLSRRMVDMLAGNGDSVMPEIIGKTAYDTFAKAYEMAFAWEMDVKILPCVDFEESVQHLWSLSFNYGYFNSTLTRSEEDARRYHSARVKDVVDKYNRRFPNGIDHLLKNVVPDEKFNCCDG